MVFENLNGNHLSPQQKTDVRAAFDQFSGLLAPFMVRLSPEERQQYGSINEQNKLLVNRIKNYHDSDPALSSPQVEWTEFHRDYETRVFLETILDLMDKMRIGLTNAKILHDSDNYKASLKDYEYTKYMHKAGIAGYEKKMREIAQFFPRSESNRTRNTTTTTTDSDSTTSTG